MKQTFILLTAISIFAASCKKSSEDTPAAPLTITKADFATNYKPAGQSYTNGTINLAATPVTIPTSGENQSWDVSTLTVSSTDVRGGFIMPANAAFPSATFAVNGNHRFGFGSLQSTGTAGTEFYEVTDNGYFYLGLSTAATDVISIPGIGGTLTYAAQNVAESVKYPEINLPASYNSSTTTTNIVNNSNFIANAPAVGVNNTPGQARITDSVNNKIIASGTLTLKNIGKVRVLVNKQTLSEKTNFFLGGAPAPTALLTMLGLTDGTVSTYVFYDFYAEGLGRVGRISTNASGSAITGAYFRVQ